MVSQHYQAQGKNHTAVNLIGSLQAAGGVEGASVGHPVLSQPSPASLLQGNCIHANDKGFTAIFENLYALYFAHA